MNRIKGTGLGFAKLLALLGNDAQACSLETGRSGLSGCGVWHPA